jgi:hypothetical protein
MRYAGLAVTGELARRLRLVELIDAELAVERRARPVKVRRRGLSPGQLVVALSECQLVGGEFFSDLEEVRADEAGSGLRTVGQAPSAPTALHRSRAARRSMQLARNQERGRPRALATSTARFHTRRVSGDRADLIWDLR